MVLLSEVERGLLESYQFQLTNQVEFDTINLHYL